MELETYLNAMESLAIELWTIKLGTCEFERRLRQHQAFRARILRMDAEKNDEIKRLTDLYEWH